MATSLILLLSVSVLLNSVHSHDRFFPGRYEIPFGAKLFTPNTVFRVLSESSEAYQTKIESSNITSDIVTTRLKGDTELGYYYITLFFGTPLQKQTLIVDTGSVTTTIPCIECGNNCGTNHFNKPFDHASSETFKTFDCNEQFGNYVCSDCTNECGFSVAYVEGSSYSGHFKKDMVAFGNEIEDLFSILLNQTKSEGASRLLEEETNSPNSSPDPTQSTEQTQPAEPVPSTEQAQSTEPAQSAESEQSTESAQSAESVPSGEQAQSTEPVPSAEPEQLAESAQSAEPAPSADAEGGIQSSEEAVNEENSENTGNTEDKPQESEVTNNSDNTIVESSNTEQPQNINNLEGSTNSTNPTEVPINEGEESINSSENPEEPDNSANEPDLESPTNSTNLDQEQNSSETNVTETSGKVVEDNSENTLSSQQPPENTPVENSETATGSANSTNTTESQVSSNSTETAAPGSEASGNATNSSNNQTNSTESETAQPQIDLKQIQEDLLYKRNQDFVKSVVEKRKTFLPFGCTERETKLFYNQEADGILGLGVTTDSNGSPPNLIDVMHRNNPSIKKAFSLCLAQTGGYLTTGGYNFAYHEPKEKIYHTDYFDNFGQYRVYLKKIEVAGKDTGLSSTTLNHGEGAFFDSGTTLTHVPTQTYNAIKNGLTDYCSENAGSCGRRVLTEAFCYFYDPNVHPTLDEFFKSFPTFTFYFGSKGDAQYEWKGQDYLARKGEPGKYCMGLSRYDRETILGGTFMKNHDIMFDKEHKRIAFVRAECGAIGNVTTPTYLYTTKFEPVVPEAPKTVSNSTDSKTTTSTTQAEAETKLIAGHDVDDDNSASQDENEPTSSLKATWNQMKGYVAFAIVGAAVVVIIFVAVRFLRRKSYNTMRNEIEIPDNRAIGLSFESNTGNLPSPGEPKDNDPGTRNTINSLVEVSI